MGHVEQIDEFISKVERVYEVDYGDFKRKVSQYIFKLERSLGSSLKPDARKLLREMRARIVYLPNPDIEIGRETAVQLAKRMREIVH